MNMFDIKLLRKNLVEVKAKLEHRGEDLLIWISSVHWIKSGGN